MRKYLFFILLVFCLVSSFSCQKRDAQTSKEIYSEIGITETEILLGSSSALTGHAEYLGTNYQKGALTYFNYINQLGGVNGRKIRLISLDDKYDPPKCILNTQKLIAEEKVFALFNYVGTPTSIKIIPMVNSAKIPLVGLFTGADAFRNPVNSYIFNIRGSYYQEVQQTIKHLIEDLGLSKIAVFYQNDSYGLDGLMSVKTALDKYDFKIAAEGSYSRGTMFIDTAVNEIVSKEIEAIIMVGTYSPCAEFVRKIRSLKPNIIFHSVSFVGPEEFAKKLGSYGNGVLISQVVPSPFNDELICSKQYLNLLKEYYPNEEPNSVSFEGFINAKIVVAAIERSSAQLTRERFIHELEKTKGFDVGVGSEISFSGNSHQGLKRIYFSYVNDGNLKFFDEWQEYKNYIYKIKNN